ncbi:MAG TPA: M23 family metallopeptidase [Blastocatellia bacterium]|nr:M23 family metallopeptidase [Blastocatellia bacterium]
MTIVRASKDVLAALILTSFISTAAATAAAQSANKQETPRPQSANQIVGATEQKTVGQQPKTEQQSASEQRPARLEPRQAVEQAAVIPPAPNVTRKNPNAIAIPADAARPEPKYAERPVVSNVTVGSLFGYRSDPFTGRAKFHSGVDIKARWGESVGASQPGIVQFAGWYHGYGNLIIINHGGGVTTHYAHLSSFDVEVGSRVERGQVVGRAGSTGRATSPHLHYEVRIDGNPVNPFQPLALDPSSDYFKQSRAVAVGDETTPGERPRRVN